MDVVGLVGNRLLDDVVYGVWGRRVLGLLEVLFHLLGRRLVCVVGDRNHLFFKVYAYLVYAVLLPYGLADPGGAVAAVLKAAYPDRKVSRMVIPDFVIGIMARFQPQMKVLNTMIGLKYHHDATKARRLLGWRPRPAKDTVLDTARYMVENNMV